MTKSTRSLKGGPILGGTIPLSDNSNLKHPKKNTGAHGPRPKAPSAEMPPLANTRKRRFNSKQEQADPSNPQHKREKADHPVNDSAIRGVTAYESPKAKRKSSEDTAGFHVSLPDEKRTKLDATISRPPRRHVRRVKQSTNLRKAYTSKATSNKANTKPTTTITNLPAELIEMIYQHLGSADDIFSLSETCQYTYNIITTRFHPILDTVQQRTIPCYDAALRLAKAQHPNKSFETNIEAKVFTIHRNARDAAYVAKEAGSFFTSELYDPRAMSKHTKCDRENKENVAPPPRNLYGHETERLLECWYLLKELVHECFLSRGQKSNRYKELEAELLKAPPLRLHVLFWLNSFLCASMKKGKQDVLGLLEREPSQRGWLEESGRLPLRQEWAFVRRTLNWMYQSLGEVGVRLSSQMSGPCAKGNTGGLRERKGLWDV